MMDPLVASDFIEVLPSTSVPSKEEKKEKESPQERVHSGLQHKSKKKSTKDGFTPFTDEDEDSDTNENSKDKKQKEIVKKEEEEAEEELDLEMGYGLDDDDNNNGKRGKKKKCKPLCCCNLIITKWKLIENTPLKFIFLFVLAVVVIPLAYVLLTLLYEGIMGLWGFTVWWTGSAAKATITMFFCIFISAIACFLTCYALYVPSFREACCGSRISSSCNLDYRDDCCECGVHFCQNCLDMD